MAVGGGLRAAACMRLPAVAAPLTSTQTLLSPTPQPKLDSCFAGLVGAEVEAAVEEYGGRVAAVVNVSPTYYGIIHDTSALHAAIARAHARAVAKGAAPAGPPPPLIVDEAHGAHLSLLSPHIDGGPGAAGSDEVGEGGLGGALAGGAEVVVHSTHKTLTSLSQASMLHVGRGVAASHPELEEALAVSLDILQSSSPSALLLASLDATRHLFASPRGPALLRRARRLAALVKRALRRLAPRLQVLHTPEQLAGGDCLGGRARCVGGRLWLDPLRLVIRTAPSCSAHDAAAFLEQVAQCLAH